MYIDKLLNSRKALIALALFASTASTGCASDLNQPTDPSVEEDAGEGGAGAGEEMGGEGGMGDGMGGGGGMGGTEPVATGDYLWSNAYGAANGNGLNQTHARAMATDSAAPTKNAL